MTVSTRETRPRAVLVSVWLPHISEIDHASSLTELGRLVHTLGFDVVATVSQKRRGVDGAAVVGGGKLRAIARLTGGSGVVPSGAQRKVTKAQLNAQELEEEDDSADAASENDTELDANDPNIRILVDHDPTSEEALADIIVVDNEISPSQMRNLERASGVEVLDRTGVIIEIFNRHAHTREAKLQVEIARLTHEAPRLREKQGPSDRQRGGTSGGKGQTTLELDRQRIRNRIAELRQELEMIQNNTQARRQRRSDQMRVALVGYTNAGKSSLMRALTGSDVLVADKLFATLGTTVRALQPETRPRVLISDTVGFIKNLPHDLVASFRSTLDEARDASLLLFVVDASDPAFRAQLAVTQQVLQEIGGGDLAQRLVLNKIDRVAESDRAALLQEFPGALELSAHNPADVRALRDWIVSYFEQDMVEATVVVSHTAWKVMGDIREHARVVAEEYNENGAILTLRAPAEVIQRLKNLCDA